MDTENIQVDRLSREQKFSLLHRLLDDLHRQGLIRAETLTELASDLMHIDYHEDEDLLCFSCLAQENEEE